MQELFFIPFLGTNDLFITPSERIFSHQPSSESLGRALLFLHFLPRLAKNHLALPEHSLDHWLLIFSYYSVTRILMRTLWFSDSPVQPSFLAPPC
jgi:hypothetical protein